MLMAKSGLDRRSNAARLEELQRLVEVKCLVRPRTQIKKLGTFPTRVASEKSVMLPVSYFAYNGGVALAFLDSSKEFVFLVFENDGFARQCQRDFLRMWQVAKSLESLNAAGP
jgi:hypothetical protein